ncbi:stalk domain-containing protein [Natranaerobius trueperi]|uniref:Copper amine oxidase-like N-terminal domain-containing protein n=1 Tax=Natranaerobius trueperi TaxID=759412 RepID=A0A226BYX8_9FIRM|nr:stalk domain-containing protein [Natranaerobius trueperi]OWZ83340.1 hypothetical protein CDO51_08970 [Natranaerobius trueperi]
MLNYKKLIPAMLLLLSVPNVSSAEEEIHVMVEDELIEFTDQKPYIDDSNRTQVPVRYVSEALQANVDWDGSQDLISIQRGVDTLELVVGEKEYQLNDDTKTMDTVPKISDNNRTMVPLRFISEGLGTEVEWHSDDNLVTVYEEKEEEKESDEEIRRRLESELEEFYIRDVNLDEYDKILTLEETKDKVLHSWQAQQIEVSLGMADAGVNMAQKQHDDLEDLVDSTSDISDDLNSEKRNLEDKRDQLERELEEEIEKLEELEQGFAGNGYDYVVDGDDLPSDIDFGRNDNNDENGTTTEEEFEEQLNKVTKIYLELQKVEMELRAVNGLIDATDRMEEENFTDDILSEAEQSVIEIEQQRDLAYKEWEEKGQKELQFAVESMYVGLLMLDKQLESLNIDYANAKRDLDEEIARKEIGLSTGLNVDTLEMQKNEVKNNLESVKNERENLQRELKTFIGIPIDDSIYLESIEPSIDSFNVNIDDTIDYALNDGVEIRLKEKKVDHEEDNLDWMEEQHGSNSEEYDMKRYELEQAEIEKEMIEEDIEKKAYSSYNSFKEAMNDVELAKEALELQKEAVNVDEIRFQNGMISETEYLNSMTEPIQTKNLYEMARLQAYLAKRELLMLDEHGIMVDGLGDMDTQSQGIDQGINDMEKER